MRLGGVTTRLHAKMPENREAYLFLTKQYSKLLETTWVKAHRHVGVKSYSFYSENICNFRNS